MAQLKPIGGTDYYLWKYLPSLPAAIIFLVLFTAITSAHCYRTVKSRVWFTGIFAIGGLFQILGYATRIACHYHTDLIPPYAIQSTFIVIAPVFYAASIYMVLGRLIRSVHGDRHSIIRPTRMTKIFVWGDILTLNVQSTGAGLVAQDGHEELGEYIVVEGLILQLIVFGFFVVAAGVWHVRMRGYGEKMGEVEVGRHVNVPWRQGLRMLYVVFFVWFPDKFRFDGGGGEDDGHVLMGSGSPAVR
ncbi:hypothetical protein OHC33_011128 [Knufia fluminis]|uniref:Uncharacterized protein n=1 Tax=Knufia fluminis TaxID=191047 RepID=A0AAN8ELX5_9EURO|nr:hypothetical protein OHC33_011128 [Knufia fluminis]